MPSHTRFMAICVGLAASLSCSVAAFAQAPPAPQPDPTGRPALVGVPSNIPWNTLDLVERRYKIEAVSFTARDETGIDWLGSDEVMVRTEDAKGSTVSDQIDDIDSGDTHTFEPAKSCIVAVRPGEVILDKTSVCDDVGEPAPLFFEVELWEKDIGFLGDFRVQPLLQPGNHAKPSGHDFADDGAGDDLIGRARLDFAAWELEAALPNVGAEYTETVVLIQCPSDVTACGDTDFPDYTFTYRITRLPDVNVGLQSVLAEAMPKIGARSELEAIVAGLRSLRALSPRQIETETLKETATLSPGR
jgi:hypothetical protein